MKLRVLGCSGGIGGALRTTSFLLDHDILLDAGTGVGDLSLEELRCIDHVFVTHSHLDHVAFIPFLVDTVGALRSQPLTLHATAETLDILRTHLFNWKLWPDFTAIPNAQAPYLRYHTLHPGQPVRLDGRSLRCLPADHVVPAVGYQVDSGQGSLVFTGDTAPCDALWQAVNRIRNLRYLIIETAFSNAEAGLAAVSKHLTPDLLAGELAKLRVKPEIFITHLKPVDGASTMEEVSTVAAAHAPRMLEQGQILEF
ncbi:MAG: 3',5'-cyclic-nucleotide phosphodiesterase [Burkholderiales bacterium]|nr:3',5'-cyclic-nucleotide phosphodiesterase [Burkholderiales bacterium]